MKSGSLKAKDPLFVLTKGAWYKMIRVNVDSIRVSLLTQHRVVVLREAESKRYLPIWIGPFEADAIAMAIQGHEPQRPLTHDLLKSAIIEMGGTISYIFVNNIHDNTFFARIVIEQHGRTIEVDARPSDAIALAVRVDVPIYVAPIVLEQAGVLFDEDEQPTQEPMREEAEPEIEMNDESLSLFRDFINTLDLDNPERGSSEKS
jgi:bifunctional DNase/RNase